MSLGFLDSCLFGADEGKIYRKKTFPLSALLPAFGSDDEIPPEPVRQSRRELRRLSRLQGKAVLSHHALGEQGRAGRVTVNIAKEVLH